MTNEQRQAMAREAKVFSRLWDPYTGRPYEEKGPFPVELQVRCPEGVWTRSSRTKELSPALAGLSPIARLALRFELVRQGRI